MFSPNLFWNLMAHKAFKGRNRDTKIHRIHRDTEYTGTIFPTSDLTIKYVN